MSIPIPTLPQHPCLSCGACCATYRVAFCWSEADALLGGVTPHALTVPISRHEVAMLGTCLKPVRCVALEGTVGVAAQCGIYKWRPSPCHALHAAWEDGTPSEQCDKARRTHGMEPLQPGWNTPPTRPPPES